MNFYSIIIPTRSRPENLEYVIKSVLSQTFKNFELIISDNSPDLKSKNLNWKICCKFKNDDRIKYVMPISPMPMDEHWEFATRLAEGIYVLILTDRFVMRPSALQSIFDELNRFKKVECAVYDVNSIYRSIVGDLNLSLTSNKVNMKSSDKILKEWSCCGISKNSSLYSNELPRGLNSVFLNSTAKKIRSIHGKLFSRMSPDYTFAFLILAYIPEVLIIDKPLCISFGNESNGKNAQIYGMNYFEYPELLDLELVPMEINTVYNGLIHDYNYIKRRVGANFPGPNIGISNYCIAIYTDLAQKEKLGSVMNTKLLFSKWFFFVSSLEQNEKKFIFNYVAKIHRPNVAKKIFNKLVIHFKIKKFLQIIKRYMLKLFFLVSGKKVFDNVLSAIRFIG